MVHTIIIGTAQAYWSNTIWSQPIRSRRIWKIFRTWTVPGSRTIPLRYILVSCKIRTVLKFKAYDSRFSKESECIVCPSTSSSVCILLLFSINHCKKIEFKIYQSSTVWCIYSRCRWFSTEHHWAIFLPKQSYRIIFTFLHFSSYKYFSSDT